MNKDVFKAPVGFWNTFYPETHLGERCFFLTLLKEIRDSGGIAKFIETCTDKEKIEFCIKNRYVLGECEKTLLK
jgi:hypothetical protein